MVVQVRIAHTHTMCSLNYDRQSSKVYFTMIKVTDAFLHSLNDCFVIQILSIFSREYFQESIEQCPMDISFANHHFNVPNYVNIFQIHLTLIYSTVFFLNSFSFRTNIFFHNDTLFALIRA